jgi:hypothetical protein
LNGFFQSNFLKNRENLEALKMAIQFEEMILSNEYLIDYKVTTDGRITRARKIYPNYNRRHPKQKITIKEKYGHLLEKKKDENLDLIEKKKYFKGKLAFNERTLDVGIITAYNPGNNKDVMRFTVLYAKHVPEKGRDFYEKGNNTWNENTCKVFNDRYELYKYIENTRSSILDTNVIIDVIEKKLNILNYNN